MPPGLHTVHGAVEPGGGTCLSGSGDLASGTISPMTAGMQAQQRFDVVVVGAGFAGMYMLYRLRELGLTARVFETGDGVGGTWYWNRYPGARCDVESMQYSYSFDDALQQEWDWSERYAGQPEILRYANHVADRFDLRSDIDFESRVAAAHFADGDNRWQVTVQHRVDGAVEERHYVSQYLVLATGCLSSANRPEFDGMDDFAGDIHHTGAWPHEGVDFTGKRVGIIGTGSSAIQSIPVIAAEADALTIFQRTANYSVPARNRTLDQAEMDRIKADYHTLRTEAAAMQSGILPGIPMGERSVHEATVEEQQAEFARRWEYGGFTFMRGFNDLLLDGEANEVAAEYVRDRIRDIVDDPETAALLSPKQVVGCKRLCLDSHYFETYNQDHVDLVDISKVGIDHFTKAGVVVDGTEHEFDCVVLATGFDAMTGSIRKIDIRGVDGVTISDKWEAGPVNYLGLSVVGFPNMFTVSGPGSPSVLTNMLVSIQQHVEWITECLDHMASNGLQRIEAEPAAEQEWVGHVNAVADQTLYPTCNSWYLGANIPGKPRVFMPLIGFPAYAVKCDEVAAAGYEGFALSA